MKFSYDLTPEYCAKNLTDNEKDYTELLVLIKRLKGNFPEEVKEIKVIMREHRDIY